MLQLLQLHQHTRRRRFMLPFCFVLIFSAACAQQARAGFIEFNDFTLTNSNGDGSAITTGNGSTLILTGPNNGSGLPGTTDLTAMAKGAGLVQFQYMYSTLDLWDTSDPTATPNDYAGYLLGSTFTLLADQDGQFGTVSFTVSPGQLFGFRIVTADNIGEPGILTISSFTAPDGASIPEPGTWSLLLVAGCATLTHHRIRRAVARKEKQD